MSCLSSGSSWPPFPFCCPCPFLPVLRGQISYLRGVWHFNQVFFSPQAPPGVDPTARLPQPLPAAPGTSFPSGSAPQGSFEPQAHFSCWQLHVILSVGFQSHLGLSQQSGCAGARLPQHLDLSSALPDHFLLTFVPPLAAEGFRVPAVPFPRRTHLLRRRLLTLHHLSPITAPGPTSWGTPRKKHRWAGASQELL